jgi:hypothetical protein
MPHFFNGNCAKTRDIFMEVHVETRMSKVQEFVVFDCFEILWMWLRLFQQWSTQAIYLFSRAGE